MSGVLQRFLGDGRVLFAIAAPAEWGAVAAGLGANAVQPRPWTAAALSSFIDGVLTGVGKANAAGAVARVLDPGRHRLVLSLGVAGALGQGGPAIGDAVCSTASIFADEGLETGEGFRTCAEMGFPLGEFQGNAVPPDAGLVGLLKPVCAAAGPVATVSTCSGTDARRDQVVARTGAIAEAMEGAAIGLVAARLGVPFAELRVISNTTGARSRQVWDLKRALGALTDLTRKLR